MSKEAVQWTELTSAQATFFTAQVDAARQVAFGQTAHEAGIVPLRANRFPFKVDQAHNEHVAVVWPDPYELNAACMVTSARSMDGGARSFTRIEATEDGFVAEGVALSLNYSRAANLYGQLHVPAAEEQSVYSVGMDFIAKALQRAALSQKSLYTSQAVPSLLPQRVLPKTEQAPKMVGVTGDVTGRLFRSLSSLASNLVVAGLDNEKALFTTQAYDLAQSLFRAALARVHRSQDRETKSTVLFGPGTQPSGVVFETEDSINVVRRTFNDFPHYITVSTAWRPRHDDNQLFIEEYGIHASGAILSTDILPVEAYDAATIVSATTTRRTIDKAGESGVIAELGEGGMHLLEQKLSKLLVNRVTETA